MDTNDPSRSPKYALHPTNALAGPSSMPELLLPPAGPPQPRPLFTSAQDLISRFQLLPAYDRYVRPYAPPVGQQSSAASATADKGKGKEKEQSVPPGATPGAGEEEDGKGEKKWKNNYKSLIKGIPGKHSMKKDDYLTTMISVPPKQKITISSFDLKTQGDAFSVSLEGLKGWNINALVAESPQAREDRKKRKELKKLAKAQGQPPLAATGTPSASGLPSTPTTATAMPTPAPVRTNTPRPGAGAVRPPTTSIPSSNPNPSQPRGRTPVGIGTPQSMPASAPGSASAFTPTRSTPTSTPLPAPAAAQASPDAIPQKRGLKREREHSGDSAQANGAAAGAMQTGTNVNGARIAHARSMPTSGTAAPTLVAGARAGTAGVRPRPLKKRKDMNGQARDMPMQQPTPHA